MSNAQRSGQKPDASKALTNAVVWTLLALVFAVVMYVYSGKVDAEKKNFYLLASAIGVVAAAINGYSGWTLYKKSQPPPQAK